MAGIYIHIPFCRKACHYCNFHFSTSMTSVKQMVQSIAKEADLQNDYINEDIATIYLGGGTPSLLDTADLILLLGKIRSKYNVEAGAEITLEANPDDITLTKLQQWRDAGINRLSIGVQSFFEKDLVWMNRAHTANQAKESIVLAQEFGFENISIDLIYGIPGLDDERWKANFDTAVSLGIPHLSCYALTVEPGTALNKMIDLHKKEHINNEQQSRQFELLMQWAADKRYDHYEISNFARTGFRSRHNSSYWQGLPYLGLGPSAHSFNGKSRQWNIANNVQYIKGITENTVPFEKEELTALQQLNEFIMIRLRTTDGVPIQTIENKWGTETAIAIIKAAEKYIADKKVILLKNHIVLTNNGKLFADGIAAALFR